MNRLPYLPDGTIGFMFQRPEIKNNDAHDAGGAKFEAGQAVSKFIA